MGLSFSRTAAPDDAVRPAASPTRWPSAVERYEGWRRSSPSARGGSSRTGGAATIVVSAGDVRWQRTDEPDAAPASGSLLLDGFTRVERKDGRLTVHARRDGDTGSNLQELVLDAADEDGGAAWETTLRQARRKRLAGEPPPDAEVEIEEGTAPTPRERQRAARQKLGERRRLRARAEHEADADRRGLHGPDRRAVDRAPSPRTTATAVTRRTGKVVVISGWRWWPPQRGGGGPRGPTSAASSAAPSAASSNSMLAGSAREW